MTWCQSTAISGVAVGQIQAEIALHMQTPYLRVELQGMPTSYPTLQQTRGDLLHPGTISPFSFKFIQLKGRPSVDVIEAMTGMHKEEEG